MGRCDDCLTCDIAFNAVMSLSRASTRGSYSRIEGVTVVPFVIGMLLAQDSIVGIQYLVQSRYRQVSLLVP